MKQKRKVKSLIPQKKFTSKSLKTAGLVFLGSALYLASITLLSTSVAFGANDGAQAQDFEEFDWTSPITDKKEVVYAARFATIDNLNNRIIDIFMNKDGVLYITPNPVIVNELLNENTINHQRNHVENGVYGHILGGDNNKVYSNNVTIIAGEENKVNTGSDNATMLGGEKNTINQGNGVPSAIIGGSENEIKENHNGSNVIIGGHKNIIESEVSGSAILGGESNTIKNNTKNAIIGGSKVTNKQHNVFAYSTDNFEPENSNSFFLNMKKGVGINMEASGALNGLYVSGAVSLGDINIKSKPCNNSNPDNYGLEGKYNGCLVGCTKDGWKMFDRGAKCEEICKNESTFNGKCPHDAEIPDSPDDYTAFCTGLANTDNATQCPELQAQMQNYKNVVFETKLIDSETKCPESEDKCIFKCDTGFHLTGLITENYKIENKKCYEDCPLPWDANTKVPTNTIITGYDDKNAYCSNEEGIHDDCSKHKATLICFNKDWYIYENGSRKANDNNKHRNEYCDLHEYKCESKYNLNRAFIENTGLDSLNPRDFDDRNEKTGTRGKYKLCIDREPSSKESPERNGELCIKKGVEPEFLHYQLVKCNEGYTTGATHPYACKKQCKLGGKTLNHDASRTFYKDNSPQCPSECEGKNFKCDDGTLKDGNADADTGTYNQPSCNTLAETCEGYNVSESTHSKYDHIIGVPYKTSRYEEQCQTYSSSSLTCTTGAIKYKLTNCNDHYHTVNNQFCVSDGGWESCSKPNHSIRDDDYSETPLQYYGETIYRDPGTKGALWIGTWNVGETISRNKCGRHCDRSEGYEKRNGQCVKDGKCDLYNINQCSDGGNSSNESTSDGNHLWRCEGDGGKTAYCHICADGYSWEGTDDEYDPVNKVDYCKQPEPDEDGECKNYDTSNESRADKDFDFIANELKCKHGTSEIAQGFIHNGYSWLCKKSGNGSDSELCHKCEPGYTWDPNEGDYGDCVEGNGDDGECIGDDCEGNGDDGECTGDGCELNGGDPIDGICNDDNMNESISSLQVDYSKLCKSGSGLEQRNGTNDSMFTYVCKGYNNGNDSETCKKCKTNYHRDGGKCVKNTTNAKCGTNTNDKYFTSLAHLMDKNNLCDNGNHSTVDQVNNQFKWTCSDSYGTVDCSATKLECDSVGQSFTNKSEIVNKCKPSSLNLNPTVTEDTNNNRFSWTCTKGDASIECTANKTNVVCKNKLIVKPNGGSIDGHTSDRTLEQDCGSTKEITNKQKSNTTSTSSCYVDFYEDQNSSKFERETARINSTTNRSFDKWTDSSNCGGFNGSEYIFPGTNGTTCTKTAQWKVNTTTYTTGTVTVAPLEREGYVFLGWTGPKNYSTGTYSHTPASCGEKFYAQWRKIENGQCENSEPYGCKNSSNTIGYITRIKSGGKDIGVNWKCKGNDGRSDTCEFKCTGEGEIFSGNDTLHNGTCVKATCPAPTITGVEGRNVSFVLNGADANATMLIKTEDNENWPSGGDVSGTSSPRSLGSTPAKGYTKMRTLCKNGVWSTDSNVVEFETQMIIDSIEGCALKYHFDGNDPISGKSCCNPVRLDYSYDGVTFSPLTTTYKNGMSFASHGKEGMVYFRYSLDGGKSWSSTTSYNMSKQSCGSSSCSRTFYDGTQLNWVANGLYAEDGYKLAEISYWSAATSNNAGYNEPCRPITNNSNCTYNTHRRTLDSVTTYDCPDRTFYLSINDSATLYNAYRNHYNNTPTDKTIIYVPGADNNWCKLEMRIASANNGGGTWFNFYVDGVATHVGNLCR